MIWYKSNTAAKQYSGQIACQVNKHCTEASPHSLTDVIKEVIFLICMLLHNIVVRWTVFITVLCDPKHD